VAVHADPRQPEQQRDLGWPRADAPPRTRHPPDDPGDEQQRAKQVKEERYSFMPVSCGWGLAGHGHFRMA